MKYYLKYIGQEEKEVTKEEYLAAADLEIFGSVPPNIIPALFMNKTGSGRLDQRSMHECVLREGLNARPGATPEITEARIEEELEIE